MRKMLGLSLFAGLYHCFFMTTAAIAVGSGGFEIATNSARAIGKSNAVVADPEDPSTLSFNAAGLSKLDGNQFTSSVSGVLPFYSFDSKSGLSESASTTLTPVPAFFASLSSPIDDLKFGVGINSPFGLQTKYESTGNFKYTSYFNELITMDYHVSGAYELASWLSVGAGFEYVSSDLKQVGKLNSNFITSAVIPGTTGLADAPFELDVDGHGVGYNLGLLIQINDSQRMGLSYRSRIPLKLKGKISVDSLQGAVMTGIFGGASFNTSADTDITLPGSVTVGYNHKINEKLSFEVDFGWTGWSDFDQIDVAFGTSNAVLNGLEPVNEDFNDTLSVYTSGTYKFDQVWAASVGYFFLEGAFNKSTYSNAIPDGDRHALTAGLQYNKTRYSIDFSYLIEYVNKVGIDNNVGIGNGTSIDGDYSGLVHIFSVGYTYRV